MAFGLGVLQLPASAFWSQTPREVAAAVSGIRGSFARVAPLQKHELDVLMHRFPDTRPEEPHGTGPHTS